MILPFTPQMLKTTSTKKKQVCIINISKTQVTRPVNTNSRTHITINNEPLKVIDDVYLGSLISQDNGTKTDVRTQPAAPLRDSVTSGSATPTASKQTSDGINALVRPVLE